MGTRSLTIFYDEDGEKIAILFRHYDGFPSTHGLELAKFLSGLKIVAGAPLEDVPIGTVANGMNDLAAQVVAHFKTIAGNVYLYSPQTRFGDDEYRYYVTPPDKMGQEAHLQVCAEAYGEYELYSGPASQVAAAIRAQLRACKVSYGVPPQDAWKKLAPAR